MDSVRDSLFEQRPWERDFDCIQGLPPGMLGHYEAALLWNLASKYYRGHGDIVDAGAFLGASSWCMTKGLEANEHIQKKAGRVHAYDLFQVWSEPGGDDASMADWLRKAYGVEMGGYESTVGVYAQNVGALSRYVQVHQGDVLSKDWPGRPIEIMFIDICKVRQIWQHLVRSFFPSLMPNISLVIHQDWHHPWLPFLHVGQEALSEYFELIVPKANDTAVFRLVDRIPERILIRVANYDFTPSEQLKLMQQSVARFSELRRSSFVRLAQAELLRQFGGIDEASSVVHKAVVDLSEPMDAAERSWFEVHAARVARKIEEEMPTEPHGFSEAHLQAFPELTNAFMGNPFKSPYHHWFRHGRWEGRSVTL